LFMSGVRPICEMMPAEGFEPPTYGLQNRCTTTVLSRHINDLRAIPTLRVSAHVSATIGKSRP
jgi:hypothetical protein